MAERQKLETGMTTVVELEQEAADGLELLELADGDLYKTKTRLFDSLARYEFSEALNLAEALLVETKNKK